ncbi:hypothetical protein HQ571_05520 [Candidatus Kuenenbacteria bacterium]|nr:hypothetical protein [Candidatus Kuenenbacteria bacterium]
MDLNTIRAGIFLVAGLFMIIFSKRLLKSQSFFTKRFKIKASDSRATVIILGIIFLIVSLVLFIVSIIY